MRTLTLFSLLLLGACASAINLMKEPPRFVFESQSNANTVLACINAHWEEGALYKIGISKELTYKPLPNGGNLSLTCRQFVCMLGGFRRPSALIKVVNKSEGGSVTTIHTPYDLPLLESRGWVKASAACNN